MALYRTKVALKAEYVIEAEDETAALDKAYELLTERNFDEEEVEEISNEKALKMGFYSFFNDEKFCPQKLSCD